MVSKVCMTLEPGFSQSRVGGCLPPSTLTAPGIKKARIAIHLQFWSFPVWRPKIKICYTFIMQSSRNYWIQWAETLRRYQLEGFIAWLLDAGRPLALLSAQMLYMGRPFLGEGLGALAHMLESDDETRAFASFLDHEERTTSGETVT